MFKQIKNYLNKFRTYLDTKEVQPLSSRNAQSLNTYGKVFNFKTMVSKFENQVYDTIRQTALLSLDTTYVVIKVPYWLSDDQLESFRFKLSDLSYSTEIINRSFCRLLLISWS